MGNQSDLSIIHSEAISHELSVISNQQPYEMPFALSHLPTCSLFH